MSMGLLVPPKVVRHAISSYMPLAAPVAELPPAKAQQRMQRDIAPPQKFQPELTAKLAPPRVVMRPRELEPVAPPVAPVKVQMTDFQPVAPKPVRPEAPRVVQTGSFSTGSSVTPTAQLAPQQVETGGFGDPNGAMPGKGDTGRVQVAQLGNFDLPSGPGVGNGTGGASGARAVVASAGFGNGTATSTPGPGRGTGAARAAGFGDARPVAPAAAPKPAVSKEPVVVPVEILHKPTPEYTEEARRLRVEGEVLLEVTFSADGRLQVLRVVRGLGHGLDEAAVRAAERIQFKPAMREGRPVSSNAVLHIVFQLA